jgi:indole-3-glycerol phosphate synthase
MLSRILESTREKLRTSGVVESGEWTPRREFAAALGEPGLQVIAEIKRRSPSAGVIASDLDPVAQAVSYAQGGAAAVSVLTEPEYFGGSADDLQRVRSAVGLPVLRKDFIVDIRQVEESRIIGADALLLIVAALEQPLLEVLLEECRRVEIEALVEAHDEAEVARAIAAGAHIVGINNRNLKTFETDLGIAERIAPSLPASGVRIAESGVSDPAGARRMAVAGYDAILVGEALVRAADPASLIEQLKASP